MRVAVRRPSLVVSPNGCEAGSETVGQHQTTEHMGMQSTGHLGRELLPPPPMSPRARKMARQHTEIGDDLTRNGGPEELGSWGWFLRRRGGSTSNPKRRKSNDGLSLAFMNRFCSLNVRSDGFDSSIRDGWKSSQAFSDSGELYCFCSPSAGANCRLCVLQPHLPFRADL